MQRIFTFSALHVVAKGNLIQKQLTVLTTFRHFSPLTCYLLLLRRSLEILNAKQYAQFRAGSIGANADIVYIRAAAHAAPLLEPPHFANVGAYKVSFGDDKGNLIDIYPRNRGVQVSLSVRPSSALAFAIPHDFSEYQYSVDGDVVLTGANVDAMLRCTNATHLTIMDAHDVAGMLLQRIDDMAKMTKLQTLKLAINRGHLARMELGAFLARLPSLRFATFVFQDWHERDVEAFLKRQAVPANWQRHGNYVDSAIFHRTGRY